MSAPPRDKPDLGDANDTDEVYRLAYELAAWGLRNGECDEFGAFDWVMGHAHDLELPRGSSGRLNPTQHHIAKGAEAAVEKYEPRAYKPEFDPEPLHALAGRISGFGVVSERYLLGAIALCHRYRTLTPVITGPLLAGTVGVADAVAGRVLSEWSNTLAYGFFTGVSYDGERGHGRVWTVDPGWVPVSKPTHLPSCNRAKARCRCFSGCRKTGDLSLQLQKIDHPKCDNSRDTAVEFTRWLETLERRNPLVVGDVAKQLGVTRAAATKLLRAQQGNLLDEFTYPGGIKRKRTADGKFLMVRSGETWFVGQP
jgi:hypothetical protein